MKNQQIQSLMKKQPMLVLSLAIFILIISGGYFYYRYETKIIRQEQYSDLKTIADLKINQILDWREERLADAHVIAESPFIRHNFQRWLLSKDSTLEKDLLERFSLLRYNYKYEDVFVVSAGGKLLLDLNANLKHIDSVTIDYCNKALQDKKAFLSDFYFSPAHDTIHFDVFAPILNDKNVPVAVLVLHVNPDDYLYPLIQSWPTSSKSAETLIVRKEGDSILYVNELRHLTNTALRLRIPITNIEIPAVQAVLGQTGIFEGIDYRGIRVLADMHPVPGTPWFMIAKVDKSEIFSELRYRTVIVIIISLLLLLFFGIGISWVYNNRQKNIYRKLLEAGTALNESQEEFRTTLYSIGDAVITTDIKGCIRNMNVVAEKLTGWKEPDVVGRSIIEVFNIVSEESREKVESPVQRVLKEGLVVGLANHTLLISKDGNEIPIADSGAPIRNEKGVITGVVLVFRDQTQERASQRILHENEQKLRKLNRIYSLLSDINQAIVRTRIPEELFKQVCKIAVEQGGFGMAWIGLIDESSQKLQVMAQAGKTTGYLDLIDISLNGKPLSYCPIDSALRQGNHAICNIIKNEKMAPCQKIAYDLGLRSSASFTLKVSDILKGAMTFYSDEPDFFDEAELKLLDELALDISFAMEYAEKEAVRKQAEKVLKESERKLREAQEMAHLGFWTWDIITGDVEWSEEVFKIFCLDSIKFTPHIDSILELSPREEDHQRDKELINRAIETHSPGSYEQKFLRPDQSIGHYYSTFQGKYDENGDLVSIVGTVLDITERKLAEEKLSLLASRQDAILSAVPDIIMEVDNNKIYTWSNKSGIEFFGDDVIGKEADFYFEGNQETDQIVQPLFNGEENTIYIESWQRRRDGEKRLLAWYCRVLKDDSGNVMGALSSALDITERKHTEEALSESEAKYRQLVAQSPDGIFVIDLSGRFISVNKAICEGLNYTEEELLSMKMLDIVPEQYHVLHKQRLMAIMNGESTNTNAEYEVIGKNGLAHFVEVLSVPYYKGMEIIGFQGIARDITERRQAEEALKQSELRFKQISENSVEWIWEVDKNGLYTYSSPTVKEILGYEPEEIINKKHFYDFFNPAVREQLKEAALGMFARNVSFKNFPNSNLHKDGRKVILSTSGIPMFDKEGNYTGYRGVDVDITEPMKAEETLRESEEKYRRIFDNVQDLYYETSVEGKTIEVSPSIEFLSNGQYHRDDLIGKSIYDFFCNTNERAALVSELMEKGAISDFEITLKNKDGSLVSCSLSSKIIFDSHGRPEKIIGSMHDISDSKNATEKLKLAKEKAEANDRLKTTFLNNISHEVRTPLNGILGFAEIMSQSDLTEEEKRVSLSMLFESSDRLLATITNYMDISLINSGTMSLYKKDFSPGQILNELYSNIEIKCLARNLDLLLEVPEQTKKLAICSDPEILRKVLTHLLNNAIKFTEKGSITYGYTVHKAELEFFINDTGIGIGKESLEKVFEHFVKEERGPLKLSEGSGLGLTISKGLVKLLGGKIWAESEMEKGSTFFFTVPVGKEIEYKISGPAVRKHKENLKANSILIAEDDVVNFFYLKTLIRHNTSAEIIHASNGREAVDKFQQHPGIGLILMDIKMPVMDGLEATRQIKAINRNVPVFAITAYAMAGDEARILDAGCDFYLVKPIDKKLLLEKIAEYTII
ncbi:MAG: hypothetical protein A2X03_02235 [Bacteroidetes bacterium GWA2_40_15]|nr:MAG: hypothetical protein A2X03_02235 [Bacteroidetes bacterium GWA2_40_15]